LGVDTSSLAAGIAGRGEASVGRGDGGGQDQSSARSWPGNSASVKPNWVRSRILRG
jgi:hypothetical protein